MGSALPQGSSAKAAFQTFKADVASLYELDPTPVRKEAHGLVRPKRFRDFVLGGGRVFLIGEAAGLVSPSSGEGISYALDSAHLLAGVLNGQASHPNRAYWRKTLPVRLKLLLKTLKSPFLYHPLLRRLVMQSGLCAISVVDAKQSEG